MSRLIRACAADELADGQMRAVADAPEPVAICRVGGEWFAFSNNCTHRKFPLSEGFVEGTEVQCPLHGARFCLRTGAVREIPARWDLEVFPVRIERGEVFVELGFPDLP
ncbi:MAG: non-heme iron oxygenase ferredoxin subunit [Nevskia sp.]|nr:non-heme iron oxygenase ferredoxin subunit [Nevskia sp.]